MKRTYEITIITSHRKVIADAQTRPELPGCPVRVFAPSLQGVDKIAIWKGESAMISKKFRITLGLLALAPVASVAVSAGPVFGKAELQQNRRRPALPKIPAPIYLVCKLSGTGPDKVRLEITNNTKSPIPKNTTIYWKVGDANKGSFILANDLTPYMLVSSVIDLNYIVAYSVQPKAWYYK